MSQITVRNNEVSINSLPEIDSLPIAVYQPETDYHQIITTLKPRIADIASTINDKNSFSNLSMYTLLIKRVLDDDIANQERSYSYRQSVVVDKQWIIDTMRSTPYYKEISGHFVKLGIQHMKDLVLKRGKLEGCVEVIGERYYFVLKGIPYDWIWKRRHKFTHCHPVPTSPLTGKPVVEQMKERFTMDEFITMRMKQDSRYFADNFRGKSSLYKNEGGKYILATDDEVNNYIGVRLYGYDWYDYKDRLVNEYQDEPDLCWRLSYIQPRIIEWFPVEYDKYTLRFYVDSIVNVKTVTYNLFGRDFFPEDVGRKDILPIQTSQHIEGRGDRIKQWKKENKYKYSCSLCDTHSADKSKFTRHLQTSKHQKNYIAAVARGDSIPDNLTPLKK